MGTSKRGIWSFLVGAAAGTAAGFWLNSDSGKDWRKETAKRAKSKGADLKMKADEVVERASERIYETVDKLRDKATETIRDLKDKYRDELKGKKHTSQEAFEAGVKKADERLRDVEAEADEKQA
ncbi:MAG: hypothetical protein V6Z82_04625 [Flavobacteriales bacterium]